MNNLTLTSKSVLDESQYIAIGNIPKLKPDSSSLRDAVIVSIILQQMQSDYPNQTLIINPSVINYCVDSAKLINSNFNNFKNYTAIDTVIYKLIGQTYKREHFTECPVENKSKKYVVLINSINVSEDVWQILLPKKMFKFVEEKPESKSLDNVAVLRKQSKPKKTFKNLNREIKPAKNYFDRIPDEEFELTTNDPESHGDIKPDHIINHFERSSRSQRKNQQFTFVNQPAVISKKRKLDCDLPSAKATGSLLPLKTQPIEKKRKLLNETQFENVKPEPFSIKTLMRSLDGEEPCETESTPLTQTISFSRTAHVDEIEMELEIDFNVPLLPK